MDLRTAPPQRGGGQEEGLVSLLCFGDRRGASDVATAGPGTVGLPGRWRRSGRGSSSPCRATPSPSRRRPPRWSPWRGRREPQGPCLGLSGTGAVPHLVTDALPCPCPVLLSSGIPNWFLGFVDVFPAFDMGVALWNRPVSNEGGRASTVGGGGAA